MIDKIKKYISRFVCKRKGHNWTIYEFSIGYWGNDIEMAGYCERCGEDTHGDYK